ncbi:glycosyltransferase [Uliginosibacterium sp. H3]|uniref:Glycosyltransferase n=1 Tax=Uliginosibacterium silvisoli TaxID=3114758 RepID=A0ABU6K8S3_9RHOO|nr:glycosyltransferase [Uliginosibacterium sp. H3]
MLKCLWIARDIPFPLDAGDKIYSANLAHSFAQNGALVRFFGFAADHQVTPPDWPVEWVVVAGKKRSQRSALFSTLPIAAASHATTNARALLAEQLSEEWDVIVLDSYGSGWALSQVLAASNDNRPRPLLVHVSHNHEASLWRDMARNAQGNALHRAALWQNYLKVKALERRMARKVDLITTITDEDAARFGAQAPSRPSVALTPGYSGWTAPERTITSATPRRVVMVGSFRWVVKQENLRRFLAIADARFHANNIVLDVMGDVPAELLAELQPNVRATHFHGFVDSVAPYFESARVAVVPELIGGGFKLKFLDYIFGRVPVATLTDAAAGLPHNVRSQMICSGDMQSLVDDIVRNIDEVSQLDAMQTGALRSASELFHWRDRGSNLRSALQGIAALAATRQGLQA